MPAANVSTLQFCTPRMVAAGSTLAEPRLSPDGLSVAFLANVGGGGWQLLRCVLGDGPSPLVVGPQRALTCDPPIVGTHPSGGGTFCFVSNDALVYAGRDGSLYQIAATGGPGTCLAASVDTQRFAGPAASPNGRWLVFVIDTPDENHIGRIDRRDPDRTIEVISGATQADFRIDPQVNDYGSVVWHEWSVPNMPWDGSRIVLRTANADGVELVSSKLGDERILAGGPAVSVSQPRFSPDGRRVAFTDDRSGWKNLHVVDVSDESFHWHVDEAFEHADPTWGLGSRSFAWAPDGSSLAFSRNEAGYGRLCIASQHSLPTTEVAKAIHLGLAWSQTPSGRPRIAAIRTGGKTPPQVVVYDGDQYERVQVAVGPVGGWEELDLPEPRVVSWQADDGVTIHGRVYLPRDVDRPLLIAHMHGGPTAQTPVQFNARFGYWLSKGWAIFVPDHRGSTGWGRAYQQAMRERWGELEVSDSAAGVRFLIDQGLCDPARIVAMGGSSGGFSVLHLLAKHPDLFAAGVDLYGVTDLKALDLTTHRYERHYNASLIGALPEAELRYVERSPLSFVDRIAAPLLVLHGDQDDTVVVDQAHMLVEEMQAVGRDVEYVEYPGEGHGWRNPATTVDELERIDAFIAKHLP